MEQKIIKGNSAWQFGKVVLMSWSLATGGVVAVVWASSKAVQQDEVPFIPDVKPSAYGVTTLHLTSDHTGEAVINLDGFKVPVTFVFEKQNESYGAKSYTTVEITNLEVGQITDGNKNQYSDFTVFADHVNINRQIAKHIEQKL